jgi:hypothetical protein
MTAERHAQPRVAPWLILGAAGFVLLYLCTDVVTSKLASSALPLPNVPAGEAQAWFAANRAATVMMGVCQLLSVACLAALVHGLRRAATGSRQAAAVRRARPWGLAAVALMACSSVLAWVLAAVAPTAPTAVIGVLRTASFITGGTAHVVALGVFVLLASRIPGLGKALRVLAWVAVVPAVASLISLFVFEGAALILLGRLLAMVWIITAAVTATVRSTRGTWAERETP